MTARSLLLSLSLIALLLPGTAVAQPLDGDPATVERVAADSPIAAAVAISQLRFPSQASARRVVLATSVDYADALAGAILTAGDGVDPTPAGPLLLTPREHLDPAAAAEITRVLPSGGEVLVLGGTAAVSEPVVDDLRARGYRPRRLFGPSRFETAVAIAREHESRSEVDTYLLARGDAPAGNPSAGWADAITGSTSGTAPILLTPQAQLHPAAREHLQGLAAAVAAGIAGEVVLLGGEAALSATVATEVPEPIPTRRLAGATRDETAVQVAAGLLGIDVGDAERRVVFFTGYADDGWGFGLPAATLARDLGAALMPVNIAALAEGTARLAGCGTQPADVLAIGSTAVLPDVTVDAHRGCPDQPSQAQIVLDGSGLLPEAQIGGPPQPAIDAVAAVLGPPTRDTGVVEGCPFDDDGPNERYVDFGDLTLAFYGQAGEQQLLFWSYRVPSGMGLETARGLGSGATNADVTASYPEAVLNDDTVFGPFWDVPPAADGPMLFFTAGTADADPLQVLYGGDVLFCE